jgi:biopolymer transport protein ExbB/TolQ
VTNALVDILYFIAAGLLLPVLLVLLGFMAATLVALGGLAREALLRRKSGRAWRQFLADLRTGDRGAEEFYGLPAGGYIERFRRQTAAFRDNPVAVKKCLDDLEIDMARRLARLSLATRVGPMLGLVGTLIPLGPALTGLAAGSMETLAGNLIIAFTTTVFGILVGGFAYAACLVRRAWYEQDVSDLEFLIAMRPLAEQEKARTAAEYQANFLASGESRLV